MHLGIVSDTHGRHETTRKALALLQDRGVTTVLHCGDIDDPDTVRLFAGFTAHFVFGNNDWDQKGLRAAAAEVGATFHDRFGHLELEGVTIAFLHGDDSNLLRSLEHADHYDYVFHGHTHHAAQRRVGTTWVVNPGALHRARPKSFAILDLATRQLETVIVG